MLDQQHELEPTKTKTDIESATTILLGAYSRLAPSELAFFARVRGLDTAGSAEELAARLARFDLEKFDLGAPSVSASASASTPPPARRLSAARPTIPPIVNGVVVNGGATVAFIPAASTSGPPLRLPTPPPSSVFTSPALSSSTPLPSPKPPRKRHTSALDLPVEILAAILEALSDWELARAVGVPTSLPRPPEWTRASPTDEALLTGFLPLIRAADPLAHPPTRAGATVTVRFGYVHVLEHLVAHPRLRAALFPAVFAPALIPMLAARHARTAVLAWWRRAAELYPDALPPLDAAQTAAAIDSASRHGAVPALEWWLAQAPALPFDYTEAALEGASAKGHLAVLDWWRTAHLRLGARALPLKIGRSMDAASTAGRVDALQWWATSGLELNYDRQALHHASHHGRVEVLQWWVASGLQLIYDAEVLVGTTRHNRPEALEWWDKSGLPVQYRMCDIEEALEDAIGGGEAAREWWRKKGVDFNANDKEWMKLQNLN